MTANLIKIGDRGHLNPTNVPADYYRKYGQWQFEVIDVFEEFGIQMIQVRSVVAPDKDAFVIYPENFIPVNITSNEVKK